MINMYASLFLPTVIICVLIMLYLPETGRRLAEYRSCLFPKPMVSLTSILLSCL
jgi:hypothetical protein